MPSILKDSIAVLQQGVDLVDSLSDAVYTAPKPELKSGMIGAHIRHNLDHYLRLIAGKGKGEVDYDQRERDERIERERAYAIKVMRECIAWLEACESQQLDEPLKIKMDCGTHEAEVWANSTSRRELQFLISHSIHHYALIAILCRLQGIEPPEGFGVAPSTLHYRRQRGVNT